MAQSLSNQFKPLRQFRYRVVRLGFVRWLAVLTIFLLLFQGDVQPSTQSRKGSQGDRKSSHLRMGMTPDDLEMLERAMTVVCLERQTDPKGSSPIDDMQARPSLPVQSPEAIAGAERAQRVLPIARELVLASLQQLAKQYQFPKTKSHTRELQSAMARVRSVRKIKPDMDSRDNASVLLRQPHTITFGTIFLVGLPSDEGMISVLAHELAHIADGDADSLRMLFRNIGNRASMLTALSIHGQRAEELTCDLIGALAVRDFVASSPSYEPIARRIARSVEHNCVDEDEGDEDHLSPRNTIRALLALNPSLTRELVYNREEKPATKRN
jgi:hypothetical protein